jgi:hypothetical protein
VRPDERGGREDETAGEPEGDGDEGCWQVCPAGRSPPGRRSEGHEGAAEQRADDDRVNQPGPPSRPTGDDDTAERKDDHGRAGEGRKARRVGRSPGEGGGRHPVTVM